MTRREVTKKQRGIVSMENVVNTLLYCYPSFQSVLDGMEKLAYYKAMVSFCDSNRTVEQVEKILQINIQKERLSKIKRIVEYALSDFNKDEYKLIAEKFFNKSYGIKDEYSQRHYFRKQKNLFEKLVLKFEEMGVNEDWFEKNCSDIYFLNAKYLTIKKMGKRKTKNCKTIINI